MQRATSSVCAIFAIVLALGCAGAPHAAPSEGSSEQVHAWDAWRAQRREELAGAEGWLTLVALDWVSVGESTIGGDASCAIVWPGAPPRVGRIVVDDAQVHFVAEPGVSVTVAGAPVSEIDLVTDDEASAPRLEVGSLRAHVITRGGQRALRVRDLNAEAARAFHDIAVYPYDPALRVRAEVSVPDPPRVLSLVNVIGMQVDEPCAAVLRFVLDGHALSLAATAAGDGPSDGFFVMLRDATAPEETYPAGRYLEVPAADASGHTWIDLNYLHTPPCGYTQFATCPLPPSENVLALSIRGGERYDHASR